jgi:hypothetical protein
MAAMQGHSYSDISLKKIGIFGNTVVKLMSDYNYLTVNIGFIAFGLTVALRMGDFYAIWTIL